MIITASLETHFLFNYVRSCSGKELRSKALVKVNFICFASSGGNHGQQLLPAQQTTDIQLPSCSACQMLIYIPLTREHFALTLH